MLPRARVSAPRASAHMRMSTCTRCLWLQIVVVTVQLLMLARQAALWQSDLPRAMWNNHSSAPRPTGQSEVMTPPPPPSPPPEAGATDWLAGPQHAVPAAGGPAAVEPSKAPPLVLFAAGVQGSGHEALSELLIRLPQAWTELKTLRQAIVMPHTISPTRRLTSLGKPTLSGSISAGVADGADGGAVVPQPVVGRRARGRSANPNPAPNPNPNPDYWL